MGQIQKNRKDPLTTRSTKRLDRQVFKNLGEKLDMSSRFSAGIRVSFQRLKNISICPNCELNK